MGIIRVAVIETWDETDFVEKMTAAQALAGTGAEFDPDTQTLVSKANGVIGPDDEIEDGDTLFIESVEGVDNTDDGEGDKGADDGGGEAPGETA